MPIKAEMEMIFRKTFFRLRFRSSCTPNKLLIATRNGNGDRILRNNIACALDSAMNKKIISFEKK